MRKFADAAYRWGEISADYAEASDRLASLIRITVAHADEEASEVEQLREMAIRLDQFAANARHDALDIGELAATLRDMAAES